jgi:hypothetical protein
VVSLRNHAIDGIGHLPIQLGDIGLSKAVATG